MKIKLSKKAFTLIEILIATAIFALVMIIVVAIFSWAAGYNNRLKETRRVGQEVRTAMDDLTKNIRLANGSGKLTLSSTLIDQSIGEITFLRCSGTVNSLNSSCVTRMGSVTPFRYMNNITATNTDPTGSAINSNAILILNKDQGKAILYRTVAVSATNYQIRKAEKQIADWNTVIDFTIANDDLTQAVSLNPDSTSIRIWFGGYGADKKSRNQQPYSEIYIIGETKDYDRAQPTMRSRFHLRTLIESRDYNL